MIDRIRKLTSAVGQVLAQQAAAESAGLGEALDAGLSQIESELARLRRIALENHALVEEALRQRDYWSEKWKKHGVEHSAAQGAMMEQIESLDRVISRRLMPELNRMREEAGQPPLTWQSPVEKFRAIFKEYKEVLDTTASEGAMMPNDLMDRRRPVDP